MTTYLMSSLGVSILVTEEQDPKWFFDMALAKGGTIHIERLPEEA